MWRRAEQAALLRLPHSAQPRGSRLGLPPSLPSLPSAAHSVPPRLCRSVEATVHSRAGLADRGGTRRHDWRAPPPTEVRPNGSQTQHARPRGGITLDTSRPSPDASLCRLLNALLLNASTAAISAACSTAATSAASPSAVAVLCLLSLLRSVPVSASARRGSPSPRSSMRWAAE